MSLTKEQENMIHNTMNHLLDFSSTPTLFQQEADELLTALTSSVSSSHPFYQLHQMFMHPTECLQRLEDLQSEPITVGEVQKYMLHDIYSSLIESAVKTGKQLDALGWDEIVDRLVQITPPPENYQLTFITTMPTVDSGTHPYYYKENGSIFSTYLIPNFQNGLVNLIVTIDWPHEQAFTTTTPLGIFDETTDEFIDEFMQELNPYAIDKARYIATEYVINWFKKNKLINDNKLSPDDLPETAKKIITDEFYLPRIKDRELSIPTIMSYSLEHVRSLKNQTVKNLIDNKLCSLQVASIFTQTERKILGIYFNQIKTKKISAQNIIGMIHNQFKILSCPLVINLINQNKLDFLTAKNFPAEMRLLFTSNLYINYFLKSSHINWTALSSLSNYEYQVLVNPTTIKLVVDEVIDLSQLLCDMTPSLAKSLKDPKRYELLKKGKMTYKEIKESRLIESFHREITTSLSIKDHAEAYAKRLYALFSDTPYIFNARKDSINQLMHELPSAAKELHTSSSFLYKCIVHNFIMMLHGNFQKNKENQTNVLMANTYANFFHITDPNQNHTKTLSHLITKASEILLKIDLQLYSPKSIQRTCRNPHATFFAYNHPAATKTNLREVQKICEKIISLDAIEKKVQFEI